MQPIAVSINDACRFIGIGRTKMYSLISEGRVASVKLGKRNLIKVDSLHALLDDLANDT